MLMPLFCCLPLSFSGSLRHAPECLMYLFHSLCGENKAAHVRYGGGLLEDVSSGVPSGSPSGRPRRGAGDFLALVVRPLYEVMVAENSKGGGRNYDDINEFFWRTECLDYYYADAKYRVEQRPPPPNNRAAAAAAAAARDIEDPPSQRASISVALALRAGKKSFLEKVSTAQTNKQRCC